ncbi:L-threonylcarbamoyladenylate synthase [Thalassococcus sp. S3]|uniref:L-threonylcarbamoyladenylate synthase n=1 Tax=Thalassococcus sp. S3 TaxID=2017482 RepID=UPI0010244CE7|nr:L-threonylcarbamoyladenylate synthase [Thalassococcus sp. S3]QBF33543.1 threonylcarbamoyl-AMP synthase [Thalassococcus sp. S3]
MQPIDTQILRADPENIARAAHLLQSGALVAFPTETVYGLGADARNGKAVALIFQAKNRPQFNPLIVHVPSMEAAQRYVHWSDMAQKVAEAFWPGPLSLVLPLKDNHGLSDLVTAGLSTLALRVPAQPTARALLERFGGPVAAPSANPSGRISPTTAEHVISGLGGKIEAVLDDGPCGVGLESTILGLTSAPQLLRPGGIPLEALTDVLGTSPAARTSKDPLTAPGQMHSHYAPQSAVRLNVTAPRADELLLGFGAVDGDLNLSPSGDLVEAAANLFAHLHALDAQGRPIAVAPVPNHGLGVAINDRLNRAAAPR